MNRIADVIAADPNNSKYIKTDPNTGAIMLQAPGGMMTSPTPEQLEHVKQLKDYIFNDVDMPAVSHGPSGGQNSQLPPPQQRVVGRQYIMGNGKPGIWTGKGFTAVTGQ